MAFKQPNCALMMDAKIRAEIDEILDNAPVPARRDNAPVTSDPAMDEQVFAEIKEILDYEDAQRNSDPFEFFTEHDIKVDADVTACRRTELQDCFEQPTGFCYRSVPVGVTFVHPDGWSVVVKPIVWNKHWHVVSLIREASREAKLALSEEDGEVIDQAVRTGQVIVSWD